MVDRITHNPTVQTATEQQQSSQKTIENNAALAWTSAALRSTSTSATAAPASVSKPSIDDINKKYGLTAGSSIVDAATSISKNPDDPNAGSMTVGEVAVQDLVDRFSGYAAKPGKVSQEGTVVTYTLEDGQALSVDINRLKTDRARDVFERLVNGLSVSEDDLKHLESDDGSENLFEGDDWDTWMRFTDRLGDADPRGQFLLTLQARGALANGYNLLPYYESPGWFGRTYRTYPGGEENPTFQQMSSADVAGVLNKDAVDARMNSLMSDPKIAADYQDAVLKAVQQVPDRAPRAQSLYDMLTGEKYTAALNEYSKNGYGQEAAAMTKNYLAELTALDPGLGNKAAESLSIAAAGDAFVQLVDNPDKIDIDTLSQAIVDSGKIAIQALRSGANVVRHGSQLAMSSVKFVEETLNNKTVVSDLATVLQEQVKASLASGQTPAAIGPFNEQLSGMTQEQFNRLVDKSYIPLDRRGGLKGLFAEAQKCGVWGSISGVAMLASFGYKLSQGAWGPDSTPLERWGAARDIFSMLSVLNHFVKSTAKTVDLASAGLNKLVQACGGGGWTNTNLWDALGVDIPTVQQMQSSFDVNSMRRPGPWNNLEYAVAADGSPLRIVEQVSGAAGTHGEIELQNLARASGSQLPAVAAEGAAEAVADAGQVAASKWWRITQFNRPAGVISSVFNPSAGLPKAFEAGASTWKRGLMASLRTIGTVTDLFGIADIVVNAIGLRDAIRAGDVAGITSSSLGIGAGAALTGAGIIGTAQLFSPALAATPWLGVASAALFGVGAVLGVVAFFGALIINVVKRHNQLQDSSDDQGAWFQRLADAGLAASDWGDRLEFLRYSYAWYGNDNTDPNKSYFEFQQAEWDHFKNTPGKHGSSLNRLNEGLHVYTDKTWVYNPDSGLGMDM